MRTRIKICGITRPQDASAAVNAGADAIGLVFYPPSPRYVSIEQAASIVASLPPFITTVGLFVNAEADTIAEVVREVRIDLIQFHGDECAAYCASHGRPWIRALRMHTNLNVHQAAQTFAAARGLLLDAYRPGVPGGTGETFDWSLIPAELSKRIILAGGLNPQNIAWAVQQTRPYAVDVSGGVESSPGIKDADKMQRFIANVRQLENPT